MSLNFRNSAKLGHSYYGRLIGNRMCYIECATSSDLEWSRLPDATPFSTFCITSYLCNGWR